MWLKDVQEVVGNCGPARSGATSALFGKLGCARVPPGAVRERFGELSELRNRLSGSSRSLSDRFGGMLDFKAVRWHCGAHAMAENTESNEKWYTLSTNALDVHIFFQGRRMWPLARNSADPGEACGAVLATGCSERGSSTVYGALGGEAR